MCFCFYFFFCKDKEAGIIKGLKVFSPSRCIEEYAKYLNVSTVSQLTDTSLRIVHGVSIWQPTESRRWLGGGRKGYTVSFFHGVNLLSAYLSPSCVEPHFVLVPAVGCVSTSSAYQQNSKEFKNVSMLMSWWLKSNPTVLYCCYRVKCGISFFDTFPLSQIKGVHN